MNQSQPTETVQPANEAAPEKSWLDLGVHTFVKIAVISVLIWWIFREEINGIVRQWLTNPSWSHGFLIPLFSLYFLNQHKDEILAVKEPGPNWFEVLLCLPFFLVLAFMNVIILTFFHVETLLIPVLAVDLILLFLGGRTVLLFSSYFLNRKKDGILAVKPSYPSWFEVLLCWLFFLVLGFMNVVTPKFVHSNYWIMSPVVFIDLIVLFWVGRKILELPGWFVGLFCLLFFLGLHPVNIVMLKFMYGKPLTMIAVIGSVVLFIGGWKILKYTWLPVAYLFFAVPLPGRLYFQLTNPMRQLAAQVATVVLNLVPQLEAQTRGSVIDVVYKGVVMEPGLDVADACSGMRLLMAFVALGVAMAYLHYRPIWQRLVLLATTVPIAILCNIVRVTVTGFIYILGNPKYAQGIYHDMLGMLMLPLAFVLYGGLAWLMSNLFVDEDEIEEEDIIVRKVSGTTTQEK